jgi:hypothetical protein
LVLGGAGLYVELPKGFSVWSGPSVGYRTFDDPSPAFEPRQDWTLSFQVTVLNRWLRILGFHPTITAIAEQRASSVDLYDYQRLRMEIGVRRQF